MKNEIYIRNKYSNIFDSVASCNEFYCENNFYLAIKEVKFAQGELWGYDVIEFMIDDDSFVDELSINASYARDLPLENMSRSRISPYKFTGGLIEYLKKFED